jgi:hypothetical protein
MAQEKEITMESSLSDIASVYRHDLTTSFNSLTGEFMRKLVCTYPADEQELKLAYKKVLLLMKVKKSMLIKKFHAYMEEEGTSEMIDNFSDKFFEVRASELELFKGVDMHSNWQVTPGDTKKAIWSYLSALKELCYSYMISKTQKPEDMELSLQAAFKGQLGEIGDITAQVQEDFRREHNRECTEEDDMSKYNLHVAAKLGVDMSQIDMNDFTEFTKKLETFELPPELLAQFPQSKRKDMMNLIRKQMIDMGNATKKKNVNLTLKE